MMYPYLTSNNCSCGLNTDQSKRPPMSISYSYSFGGGATSFFSYFLGSSFLASVLTGAETVTALLEAASTSLTL